MIRIAAIFVLLLALWLPCGARAHALDPGFLELQALGGETWRVLWRVPLVGDGPMPIGLILPATCAPAEVPDLGFDGRAFSARWVITCPGGIEGSRIAVPGLETTQTDVLVRYELRSGVIESHLLTAAAPAFDVPAPLGRVGVVKTYLPLGISHILTGVDHLLFVFVLLLLIRNGRTLLGAVTAFTVAHSLTLAAAALGWIILPSAPVEAMVALSIMFLAAELMRPEGRGLRLTDRFPWLVAFVFGLLHGLGFAGALLDIGLPKGEVPLALLIFNVGVEVGQILFILFVVATGFLLRRFFPAVIDGVITRGSPGSRLAGYAAGSIAGLWFVERVAAF